MSIVAISDTLGSHGDAIGRELAGALGWEFADREIIARAAERFGDGQAELWHVTDERPTFWERFTDSWRRHLAFVEATIFELAARGRVVLVGHGAAVMLRPVPHALRVRVTAPVALRAERVRQAQGLVEQGALDLVRDTDRERAARMKFLYQVDVDDPLLYDLVLNTGRLEVVEAAGLIRQALAAARVQPSAAGLTELRDLSLAAAARARLCLDPATRGLRLSVTATGGWLTVMGTVDGEEQRAAVLGALGQVPGAAGVRDEMVVLPLVRSVSRT